MNFIQPRGLRLRSVLLGTVAAGALSLGIGRLALAGPDACTIVGTVATCTGNQSAGIASGTDFTAPPDTTLNVNNLTLAITPTNGIDGINFTSSSAVVITSNTGTFGITTAGTNATGIFAESTGGGAVTLISTGNITTAGDSAFGIGALSVGTGAVTVTSTGNITTAGSFANGIDATGVFGGPVTVTSTGNITTQGDSASGIDAISVGPGTAMVMSTGNITTAGTNATGIFAESTGGGAVTLISSGNITTAGTSAYGLDALSVGVGAVIVTSTGSITTANTDATGILAESTGGGPVTVTSTGNVATAGGSAFGIEAVSVGAGPVTVTSTGNITTAGSFATGIDANSIFGGPVTVTSIGNITTQGDNSAGIAAINGGVGAVMVISTGNISTAGTNASGILAESTGAGAVNLISTGNITVAGANTNAIMTESVGGPIAVTINSGTVSGGQGSGAGIDVVGGTNNTITNRGTVTALSGLAIQGDTGNNTVTNFGAVIGSVVLGSGTNAFNNQAGGLFNAGAIINLGAGNTLTNAGTLSPGGAGTIQTTGLTGNLVQTATGRLFADINIAGATSDRVNVSGTATLAGAVQMKVQNAILGPWQQTVVSATGGTTNNGLSLLANPVLHAQLIYPNATDVAVQSSGINFLVPGLNGNQTSIANGLNGAALIGGLGGPVFNALLNGVTSLSSYGNALTQLSGEAATGGQGASFQLTNSFLALLTGPADATGGGPAMPFAPERADAFPDDAALAYASVLKAPATKAPVAYQAHWSTWGAAFGGGSTTSGDPAGAGTNSVSAHIGGFAAGIDYHAAPDTIVGAALAGGGTNWSLGAGLGGGRSDTFLAGLYGSKRSGQAYVTGALTFSSNWMTTSRSISVAGPDSLTAAFNAQDFGGRLEGGYRVPAAVAFSVTPYAAAQAQTFHSPAYRETGTLGAPDPFALAFNAQSAAVVRTELGSRFDKTFAQADAGTINLFGRVAWAHDWQSNPNLAATFIGLPAATFVVNGAAPPTDLALLRAGAEWRWGGGWSVMARFDGEFASRSQSYSGTAILRHAW